MGTSCRSVSSDAPCLLFPVPFLFIAPLFKVCPKLRVYSKQWPQGTWLLLLSQASLQILRGFNQQYSLEIISDFIQACWTGLYVSNCS